jgi:hypothetical protein
MKQNALKLKAEKLGEGNQHERDKKKTCSGVLSTCADPFS